MDELVERLEFLEHVCRDVPSHESLMMQVSEVDSGLTALLGNRKNAIQKQAANFTYPNDQVSLEIKEESIALDFTEIMKMADSLEILQLLNL